MARDETPRGVAHTPHLNTMKTEYPETITTPYWEIMQSDVFRLDGKPIDLPDALARLARAVHGADDLDEFVWSSLGEHTEAALGDLIVGAYWALSEWHAGQSSPEYAALCALGEVFKPGCTGPPEEGDESPEAAAYELIGKWFEERSVAP